MCVRFMLGSFLMIDVHCFENTDKTNRFDSDWGTISNIVHEGSETDMGPTEAPVTQKQIKCSKEPKA